MRQILCYVLLMTGCLCFSSCNTVRGFGEDISSSANFVEKKMGGEDASSSNPSNPPQWPK